MYPLLLKPTVKDYLWGGTKLKTEYRYETDREIAAEAWVLSCHKDGQNTVINGEFSGKTLSDVLNIWGKEALGEKAAAFPYFPVLIKLIDAKQKLSVQVHPDDDYALAKEGEFGKTEMWYVVDCEEGAQLIYGFSRNLTKEEFERRIRDNTLTEVCNFVPVHKGDIFFIEAGTLHAIGEGILIAEVQQNSNTTYRVSDYGRLGADGKPRPLHIEKALEVTKRETPIRPYGNVGETQATDFGSIRKLASCSFFTTSLINLEKNAEFWNEKSFLSLLLISGSAQMKWKNEIVALEKGASLFLPAGEKIELSGNAEILCSSV